MNFSFALGTVPTLLIFVAIYAYMGFSLMTIANQLVGYPDNRPLSQPDRAGISGVYRTVLIASGRKNS